MKKLYTILIVLCFSLLLKAADEPQILNALIQEDLNQLEADIKRAEESHKKEQEYLELANAKRAQEEDETIQAAALFEKIQEQAEQRNKPDMQQANEVNEEIKLEDILTDLGALNKTEEEILQEEALQNDIQEALKTADDIEVA